MQHKRNTDSLADPGNELDVQNRVAAEHRVRASDRDGERVNAGCRDVTRRFLWVGAGRGRMNAVFAADLAKLRFDPHVSLLAPPRHLGRHPDVFLVGKLRGVIHHGPDTEARRLVDQIRVGRMIQVHHDRHRR
jgi:hypothetical protein